MAHGIILSLGSINVDFQLRVQRWPGPGETLLGDHFLMDAGGKGANVALVARRLGADARLIARVGADVLAEQAMRHLRAAGVDLSATQAAQGAATGVAMIVVRPDGNKTILMAANANESWDQVDIDRVVDTVREAPAGSVLVADLEIPPAIVRRAAEAARAAGHRVILDPSPTDRADQDLCRLADYLTPNAGEAQRLTGIPVRSPEDGFRAADALRQRGAAAALVKLLNGGCVLVGERIREHVAPLQVDVVDKSGAGDAFAGALGVALLEGRPEQEAAKFAMGAAGYVVTRYGSQAAYPTREELERFLSQFGDSHPG